MKTNDVVFAIVSGLAVAWIALDFFAKLGWVFFIVLPILAVAGLWLAEFLGKKFLFIHQAGKFFLVGAFADVIDIKVFQFLFFLAPFSLAFKAISFLVAMAIKYWINKHWAFSAEGLHGITPEKYNVREIRDFSLVTAVGLLLNVVSFYFFGKIETGLPHETWTELSIILAALVAAVSNFLGYKFIVFKK